MSRQRRPQRVLPDSQPDHADALLVIALQAAVPLYIAQLVNKGEEGRDYLAHEPISCGEQLRDGPCPCAGLADIIATHSAAMAGGDRGDAAKAFNAIAQALALASYLPGGVTFAGLHWEAEMLPDEDIQPPRIVTRQPIGDVL